MPLSAKQMEYLALAVSSRQEHRCAIPNSQLTHSAVAVLRLRAQDRLPQVRHRRRPQIRRLSQRAHARHQEQVERRVSLAFNPLHHRSHI